MVASESHGPCGGLQAKAGLLPVEWVMKLISKKKKASESGESFRVGRYRYIEGRCLYQVMSAKTKVTKTKTALRQETYDLSDLNHDLHRLHCGIGFVELGDSASVSQ